MVDVAAFSLTELLPDTPTIQVVNVGAADTGTPEPYEALVDKGYARVIGFEANPEECAKLTAAAQPGRTFLPYALGAGGPALFYETMFGPSSSLFEPDVAFAEHFQGLADLHKVRRVHNLETRRLDDLGLPPADYLKIDVQGAELIVMQNGERTLASCLVIDTEVEFVPLYKDQPLYGDVDAYLRSRGFLLHTLPLIAGRCFKPFMQNDPYAALRQLMWGDAAFVRDIRRLGELSTPQLMKFAVMAHDFYGSYDLCLRLLIELDGRIGAGSDLEGQYLERMPPET